MNAAFWWSWGSEELKVVEEDAQVWGCECEAGHGFSGEKREELNGSDKVRPVH
jgi:hypothetical protein